MRVTRSILVVLNQHFPAPQGLSNSLTLNTDSQLSVNIWVNGVCRSIYLDDTDLNKGPDVIIADIKYTLAMHPSTPPTSSKLKYLRPKQQ